MNNAVIVFFFLLGLALILKGGDIFVDASLWIADVRGIPKAIVGATVVSIATTVPELFVSMFSACEGKFDMALGNAVGSVTCNLGLVLALSLMFLPSQIKRKNYIGKGSLLIIAAVVVLLFSFGGKIGIVPIIILALIFFGFIYDNVGIAKKEEKLTGDITPKREIICGKKEVFTNILKFVLGAVMVAVGAPLVVDNGSNIAVAIGVPERVAAVTFIALGTSLPELVTTITAIAKKQSALSIGNIIGASLIDLTLIIPVSSLVSGSFIQVSRELLYIDIPACLLMCALAVVPTIINKKAMRWQGGALLCLYSVYVLITSGLITA